MADTGVTAEDLLQFLNSGGVLGITTLIIWTGRKRLWVWGWVYERSEADRKEEREENKRLHEVIEQHAIPALVEATNAIKEDRAVVLELQVELERRRR